MRIGAVKARILSELRFVFYLLTFRFQKAFSEVERFCLDCRMCPVKRECVEDKRRKWWIILLLDTAIGLFVVRLVTGWRLLSHTVTILLLATIAAELCLIRCLKRSLEERSL